MQTIEGLKRNIRSTEDLLSVVKTMKAMAAVISGNTSAPWRRSQNTPRRSNTAYTS